MRDTVEERIIDVARRKLLLTKIMDDDRGGEATEQLTSTTRSKEKESGNLHLSRMEAHSILKTGLEILFADDDGENEDVDCNNEGLKAKDGES